VKVRTAEVEVAVIGAVVINSYSILVLLVGYPSIGPASVLKLYS
jgi:hypothetical protein